MWNKGKTSESKIFSGGQKPMANYNAIAEYEYYRDLLLSFPKPKEEQ